MNYAVILAGGVGSRFWPFSRELEPKQFLRVVGKRSLLQATVKRLHGLVPDRNVYVVTNHIYLHEIKNQLHKFNIPEKNIILEPSGKNTAPAIGLCAQLIKRIDEDAILLVLPSDHHITDAACFRNDLRKAIACAREGLLVTIGIKPTHPSTGYGYIKISKGGGLRQEYQIVEKFLEKPSLLKAKKYFKDKNFFWNSGIFAWKACVFLNEIKTYLPDLHSYLEMIRTPDDIKRVWHKIAPISVDYGILERSKKIALIPANFYWTDLGSWDALNEVLPKDKKGNIIQADSLDFGSSGICVVSRGNRLISTIGLQNLIIADTPDALLVCSRDRSQDVKKVVDYLKKSSRREHMVHTTEKRPWGSYTILQQAEGFKIKLIEIAPKKRLSLQSHEKRAEHWVVVSGCAKVTTNRSIKIVPSNESIYISKKTKHRLENPTNKPLKIVEVQTGSYLEEDDIKRFDDDFRR